MYIKQNNNKALTLDGEIQNVHQTTKYHCQLNGIECGDPPFI